jgi:hypothetical protein
VAQHEEHCTPQYGHVGDIEYTGAQRPNPNVKEVCHPARIYKPVQQIAGTATRNQRKRADPPLSEALYKERRQHQSHQHCPSGRSEENKSQLH